MEVDNQQDHNELLHQLDAQRKLIAEQSNTIRQLESKVKQLQSKRKRVRIWEMSLSCSKCVKQETVHVARVGNSLLFSKTRAALVYRLRRQGIFVKPVSNVSPSLRKKKDGCHTQYEEKDATPISPEDIVIPDSLPNFEEEEHG